MNLSVPTNWQPDLLDKINKSKVIEVYGKLDRDPVGGGRSSIIMPYIDKGKVKEYILAVHKNGLKFNYLLNATCLGNTEWSFSGQKRIRKFLDWLTVIGVDAVTVAVPYLLQLIKKCYPHLETKVSVCAQVANPLQAKYWEELGTDEINLAPWVVNRDFKLLNSIREAVNCRIQLYANTLCLSGCPFVSYHYSCISHSSRTGESANEFFADYPRYSCDYLRLSEPWRLISACWIRPEDLHYYEEAGINTIKLSERGMKTEHIQRIVEAYTTQRYDGNLMDLFVSPLKRLAIGGRHVLKRLRFFFRPLNINIPRFYNLLNQLPDNDPTFLDNRKLDGFLDFFIEGKCNRINCHKCGYCQMIADKAVHIPIEYKSKVLPLCKDLLGGIIDGSLFYIKKSG